MPAASTLFGLAALVLASGKSLHYAVGAWLRWRDARARRGPHAIEGAPPTGALDARLARMEQALEVQGVEIERIAEAQRYVTRLLAAAGPGAALPQLAPGMSAHRLPEDVASSCESSGDARLTPTP